MCVDDRSERKVAWMIILIVGVGALILSPPRGAERHADGQAVAGISSAAR